MDCLFDKIMSKQIKTISKDNSIIVNTKDDYKSIY